MPRWLSSQKMCEPLLELKPHQHSFLTLWFAHREVVKSLLADDPVRYVMCLTQYFPLALIHTFFSMSCSWFSCTGYAVSTNPAHACLYTTNHLTQHVGSAVCASLWACARTRRRARSRLPTLMPFSNASTTESLKTCTAVQTTTPAILWWRLTPLEVAHLSLQCSQSVKCQTAVLWCARPIP